jgi:hypothetical protein
MYMVSHKRCGLQILYYISRHYTSQWRNARPCRPCYAGAAPRGGRQISQNDFLAEKPLNRLPIFTKSLSGDRLLTFLPSWSVRQFCSEKFANWGLGEKFGKVRLKFGTFLECLVGPSESLERPRKDWYKPSQAS